MLKDRKNFDYRKSVENFAFILLITFLGMCARFFLFPVLSGDMQQFLLPWYDLISENGGIRAVGIDIGDYMPTYYYILALLTYLPLDPMYAIKLSSCIADIVLALMAMLLVYRLTYSSNRALMTYGVVFFMPSVILNSAGWGQCDAIFTLFILASVYCLVSDKDWGAVICFSIAFVFKIQAIFFAPVLLVMLLKKKIRFRTLAAFPLVYLLAITPALIAGGDFLRLITVYFRQSQQYSLLNMYIPNAWGLLFDVRSDELANAGVMFAGGVVLIVLFWIYRTNFKADNNIIITMSALFTLLVPFVLPHMHERYYYLATVLSLIFALCESKLVWTFLIMEFCSFQVVAHNLFEKEALDFNISVLMIALVLGVYFLCLYRQMNKHTISADGENNNSGVV